MSLGEAAVTGVILAVIFALVVTNPSGDTAVLSGIQGISTGTIGAIGSVK